MNDTSVMAVMGLMCADCSYFYDKDDEDMGTCLLSPSFGKVHCRNNACSAFLQRGCGSESDKRVIENLSRQYIEQGVKSWRNPFAK